MLFPCFLRKRRLSFLSWRSSPPEVFCKKVVFRNFTKFTGKHLRQNLFFDKVAGLRLLLNSFFLNRGGFLFTYFIWILWNQIKCNEIYIKLCFMKQSERTFHSVSLPYQTFMFKLMAIITAAFSYDFKLLSMKDVRFQMISVTFWSSFLKYYWCEVYFCNL